MSAVTLSGRPVLQWLTALLLVTFLHPLVFSADQACSPWRPEDRITNGWDWSLPEWVEADPSSAIKTKESNVSPSFPGRIARTVSWTWRRLEPTEGQFEFDALRADIVKQSQGGRYFIEFHLRASVWELRNFPDETYYPDWWQQHVEDSASAPRWLAQYEIPLVEMSRWDDISTPFQVINMDIYHPAYHSRYVRMVEALGSSGIPAMDEVSLIYVHLWSRSRGEEGMGPLLDDPRRTVYEERLQVWANACPGVEKKLCLVSPAPRDIAFALSLGMGQRNGGAEVYMRDHSNEMLGQSIDPDGYMTVDESCPLIAENRASGDENEQYIPGVHEPRFGPVSTWSHRYRESMLRVLQMRRNYVWAEMGDMLVDRPLLGYVALELGRHVNNTPDVWCYLRENVVGSGQFVKRAKNFERWLYQRDGRGCRTVPTEKVYVQNQDAHHPDHMYDYTARRTDTETGNTFMGFAVDDRFLFGGPHRVAVKITYRDRNHAEWALQFEGGSGLQQRTVQCADTGKVRTATFMLDDIRFDALNTDHDFSIQALQGDAVIHFVRVIPSWRNMEISTCNVRSGTSRFEDSIRASGVIAATAEEIASATEITVGIWSDETDCLIYSESIPFEPEQASSGRYRYSRRLHRGRPGAISTLTIDFDRRRFSLQGKYLDLAGLAAPVSIVMEIGDFVGAAQVNQAVVNGGRRLPLQLMSGFADTLHVGRVRVSAGRQSAGDRLSVRGSLALRTKPREIGDVVVTWNDRVFTVPAADFSENRRSAWICRNADIIEGGLATIRLDLDRCNFMIAASDVDLQEKRGSIDFGLAFADFNQTTQITLPD